MNETMKTIMNRRSIRAFEETPIPKAMIEELLQAALYAPSGKGLQTWKFTAVLDPAKIQQLAALIKETLNRDQYDMYCPQAIIIPSNEADSPFGMEDNACALENIFLAAHSMGLGSVWINQLRDIHDVPAIRALLTEWEIPENHRIYGMAALGYPAPVPEKPVVKTGTIHIIECNCSEGASS